MFPDMLAPDMMAGNGDPQSEASFATGLLAGAGLREISQVLGLSRRREGAKGAAEPPAAQMLQGQMGDLDKLMLLARMGSAAQGGPQPPMPPGMPMPGAPPMGGPPMMPPPMPGLPPAGPMAPPMMPPPGMGAPPMGMPPMGGPPMPPGGGGGNMAQALLTKLLASAGGAV